MKKYVENIKFYIEFNIEFYIELYVEFHIVFELLGRTGSQLVTHKVKWSVDNPINDYILDIETAQDDSTFVFEELGFQARLPKDHQTSKTKTKSLEDYFKDQGCSVVNFGNFRR